MFQFPRTRAAHLAATWAVWAALTGAASAQTWPPPPPPPPPPVQLQPPATPTADPPGYREAVEQAIDELSRENYDEARARFWRAHSLLPNARTLRGLGIAEFGRRNYGECIRHLEGSLASSVRPLDEGLRVDTKQLLERANDFVARFTLSTKPRASRVLIDGLVIDVPENSPVLLQVGDHTVEVHAAGYQPERRRLSVKGGENETVTMLFTKPADDEPRAQPSARKLRKSPWLWSAVGVVVAGAATGAAVAFSRNRSTQAAPYVGTTGVVITAP